MQTNTEREPSNPDWAAKVGRHPYKHSHLKSRYTLRKGKQVQKRFKKWKRITLHQCLPVCEVPYLFYEEF